MNHNIEGKESKEVIEKLIETTRKELNRQIKLNEDYENILKISEKLDRLIKKYYAYILY